MKNNEYFWRKVPGLAECLLDAFPRAPVPINASSIVVNGLVFTDTVLEFTTVWDPPSILYGTLIEQYEIHIGRDELAPLDELQQNQSVFSTNVTTVRSIHTCTCTV